MGGGGKQLGVHPVLIQVQPCISATELRYTDLR